MRILTRTTLTAAAIALALTGCSSAGSPAEDIDLSPDGLGSAAAQEQMAEMYERAVENNETSVVVYGPGEVLYAEAYRVFEARYPEISVQGEYIYGAELATRLDQEFGSGKRVGSVQTGGPAMTLASKNADRCEPWEPIDDSEMRYYLPEAIDADGAFRGVVGYPFGMAYNTDVVGDTPPTGWADMASPEWKGNFVIEDPRMVNGMAQTVSQLLHGDYFDEAWLEAVRDNDPEIRANSALTVQAVSTGQVAFDGVAQYVQYLPVIQSGEPVAFVFPTEGVARMEYHYTCRLQDAPNPNATDLFMNWLFTPEGQQALSGTGVYGLHASASAPEGLADLDEVKDLLLVPSPMSEANAVTQEGIATSKRVFG